VGKEKEWGKAIEKVGKGGTDPRKTISLKPNGNSLILAILLVSPVL
jgi:hypothetical protein